MARSFKNRGYDESFRIKANAKPDQNFNSQFCEICDVELFPEEMEIGICDVCQKEVDRIEKMDAQKAIDDMDLYDDFDETEARFGLLREMEVDDDI